MRTIDKPGVHPIRPLLDDPTVTEIMINGYHQVYVERHGKMVEVPKVFSNPKQLDVLVDNLIGATGRAVTAKHRNSLAGPAFLVLPHALALGQDRP